MTHGRIQFEDTYVLYEDRRGDVLEMSLSLLFILRFLEIENIDYIQFYKAKSSLAIIAVRTATVVSQKWSHINSLLHMIILLCDFSYSNWFKEIHKFYLKKKRQL